MPRAQMPDNKATERSPRHYHASVRTSWRDSGNRGDGNCFFRSLSFLLTGVQQQYSQLCNACTAYMEEHKDTFEALAQCENYFEQSKMNYNGTYATEVEIFAMASLLNTTVFTYSPFGNTYEWQKFSPLPDLPSVFEKSSQAIYLLNMHEHFSPVTEM